MSGTRTLVHLLSVAMLFLWGGVLLYFYISGRLVNYLPPDGIFRPMVLVSGIGLVVLGLFNLLTMGAEDAGCEGHDHSHDHDHDHKDCGHDHAHKEGCCGHDHGHEHTHEHGACDHDHAHAEGCGHDHDHAHEHKHEHGCCGHEHGHHHHQHKHVVVGHQHAEEGHAHGILEESSWPGRIAVLLILAAPLSWAALSTPDRYSPNAVVNKGLYDPNYNDTSRAEQFSLQNKPKTAAPAVTASVTTEKPASTPPPGVAAASAAMADGTKTVSEKDLPKPAQESKSYGSFTLEDLKAQVPQSKEGNFILEVPELYYTGGDVEVQKVLTGQMVETVAQILPEKVNNADGHRLRIFRMLVQCCAADARPYSVPVDFGKKAPEYKDMTWVKVVGKMNYKKEGDQTVPIIEATKVEETTAPDNAMIY